MKYFIRLFNIIFVILKFFFKIIAVIGYALLIAFHCIMMIIFMPIILLLNLIEIITVRFIYYIVTGKKYTEKYNPVLEIWLSLICFEHPILEKEKQKKYLEFLSEKFDHELYLCYLDSVYGELWVKIKNINLKLKYE